MVLMLLGGLLLAVLAWVLIPTKGPEADPAASADLPVGGAALEPGSLSDPDAIGEREPTWEPDGVLPPDSPYRAGIRPRNALIRGRVVRRELGDWPRRIEILLIRAATGEEAGRAHPTEQEPAFRFEHLDFGAYRLRLEADGCVPWTMEVGASVGSPDQFLSLPLQSAAGIEGMARWRDGTPAAGVPVTVEPVPRTPRDAVLPLEAWTGEDGRFLVQGLVEADYLVYPGPARSPVGERVAVRVGTGAPRAWVELQLPPLASARVVVEDPQGAGFAGVRVKAQRTRLQEGELPYEETRPLGADGVLRFSALPPGSYAFTAWGGAFAATLEEALVVEGVEPEVRIKLRPDPRGLGPR